MMIMYEEVDQMIKGIIIQCGRKQKGVEDVDISFLYYIYYRYIFCHDQGL